MFRFAEVLFTVALVCASLGAVLSSDHFDFGYDDDGALGPDKWKTHYKTCEGKYQSPIDIEEALVKRVSLPPLEFSGFRRPPANTTLTNNGHTVMLQISPVEPVSVSGGPLSEEYLFGQLHFHWGNNDSYGSEDLINNHSYPMELHMVFYKAGYGSMQNAMNYTDGLVVMALFYEIDDANQDNIVYSEMIGKFPEIEYPNHSTQLNLTLSLGVMLPKDTDRYFTYVGSLTTPPCLEVVRWIDFKHPIYLSHDQLNAFRQLRSLEGYMTHNARPVQPLSDRPVWYNVPQHAGSGANPARTISSANLVVFTVFAIFLAGSHC